MTVLIRDRNQDRSYLVLCKLTRRNVLVFCDVRPIKEGHQGFPIIGLYVIRLVAVDLTVGVTFDFSLAALRTRSYASERPA